MRLDELLSTDAVYGSDLIDIINNNESIIIENYHKPEDDKSDKENTQYEGLCAEIPLVLMRRCGFCRVKRISVKRGKLCISIDCSYMAV